MLRGIPSLMLQKNPNNNIREIVMCSFTFADKCEIIYLSLPEFKFLHSFQHRGDFLVCTGHNWVKIISADDILENLYYS